MRSHKTLQKQRKDAVRKYSIHKVLGATYTTQEHTLHASWEKGSVENCNRIVRRLETVINSIHRLSLGGMSAHDYAEAKRSAA